ncbi:MAG: Trp biosynthesis-associated membrane protein [Candidatus Nanopelagicales bacterium]
MEKLGVTVSGVPVTTTSWWLPAALGGLLVVVGGVLALLHRSRWPTMGRRYDLTDRRPPARTAESAWDLLDFRGVDPTADGAAGDGAAGDGAPPSRPADGPGTG